MVNVPSRRQEGTAVMQRYLVVSLALFILALGTQISAHHSFAATYLEDQSVTIEGQIVQFLLRNPHSFVHVQVKEKDGTTNRYVVEWGSPADLQPRVSRDTLRPGDEVVITGNPGRNPADHRMRLLTFKRPKDGWSWGILENEQFN
jgi:hypothetical protein